MNETEQQIALCEWMGWTLIRTEVWDCELGEEPTGICPTHRVRQPLRMLNINSLDVLHEMEKKVPKGSKYCAVLFSVAVPNPEGTSINSAELLHVCATAAQRRESLLRVIGKWKEPQP